MDYSAEAIRRVIEIYTELLEILESEVRRIKKLLSEWECYLVQTQEGESMSYADYAQKYKDI